MVLPLTSKSTRPETASVDGRWAPDSVSSSMMSLVPSVIQMSSLVKLVGTRSSGAMAVPSSVMTARWSSRASTLTVRAFLLRRVSDLSSTS